MASKTSGARRVSSRFPQVGIEVMSALAAKLHQTTQALTEARARLDELDKGKVGG